MKNAILAAKMFHITAAFLYLRALYTMFADRNLYPGLLLLCCGAAAVDLGAALRKRDLLEEGAD